MGKPKQKGKSSEKICMVYPSTAMQCRNSYQRLLQNFVNRDEPVKTALKLNNTHDWSKDNHEHIKKILSAIISPHFLQLLFSLSLTFPIGALAPTPVAAQPLVVRSTFLPPTRASRRLAQRVCPSTERAGADMCH